MRPLLVLVGPSGAGKSTLARGLVAEGLADLHRTWTTRPPRPGETSQDDHRFADLDSFATAEAAGAFAVVVELFGHRYGLPPLPASHVDRPNLLLGRTPLLPLLAPLHTDPLVYAVTAAAPALHERLRQRGLAGAEQRARDAYDLEERGLRAHRAFDTTTVEPSALLRQVADCLKEDLSARALMGVAR